MNDPNVDLECQGHSTKVKVPMAIINEWSLKFMHFFPDVAFNPKDDVMDSDDEDFDSDLDLDDIDVKELGQEDVSDAESVGSGVFEDGTQSASSGKKDKRYFWQYNTQSKGPKGKRLCKVIFQRYYYQFSFN